MLVCHCLRVFDRTIRECLRSGARTCDEVSERCGAASRCGGCRASVEAIVNGELALDTGELALVTGELTLDVKALDESDLASDVPANDKPARVAA